MTDDQIRGLDGCARAVQLQLAACARTKTIDPFGEIADPAVALAIEASCMLAAWREMRGKPAARVWFA